MNETPTTPAPAAPAPTTLVGETSFWLDGRVLLAALKFASGDATRYALNGVNIETDFAANTIRVMATDGRRAVAMKVNSEGEPQHDGEATRDSFIFPEDLIKRIKPLVSKASTNIQVEVQAGPKDGKRRVLVMSPISKRGVIGETVEAVFPNVAVVFQPSPEPLVGGREHNDGEINPSLCVGSQFFGAINADYVADFAAFLRVLDPRRSAGIQIFRSGDATRVLHVRPTDVFQSAQIEAVIMPINYSDPDNVWECPSWLATTTTEAFDLTAQDAEDAAEDAAEDDGEAKVETVVPVPEAAPPERAGEDPRNAVPAEPIVLTPDNVVITE